MFQSCYHLHAAVLEISKLTHLQAAGMFPHRERAYFPMFTQTHHFKNNTVGQSCAGFVRVPADFLRSGSTPTLLLLSVEVQTFHQCLDQFPSYQSAISSFLFFGNELTVTSQQQADFHRNEVKTMKSKNLWTIGEDMKKHHNPLAALFLSE